MIISSGKRRSRFAKRSVKRGFGCVITADTPWRGVSAVKLKLFPPPTLRRWCMDGGSCCTKGVGLASLCALCAGGEKQSQKANRITRSIKCRRNIRIATVARGWTVTAIPKRINPRRRPAASRTPTSTSRATPRAGRKFRRVSRRGTQSAQRVQPARPEAQSQKKRRPA